MAPSAPSALRNYEYRYRPSSTPHPATRRECPLPSGLEYVKLTAVNSEALHWITSSRGPPRGIPPDTEKIEAPVLI